jgi:V-type H+-transporting ATPase subunit C
VEEELKEATNVFQEKKQLLNALQRKKGGNLMVADLHDVFTPQVMKDLPFVDSE